MFRFHGRLVRAALGELWVHRARTLITASGVGVAVMAFTVILQLAQAGQHGVDDAVVKSQGRPATLAFDVSGALTGEGAERLSTFLANRAPRYGVQNSARVTVSQQNSLVGAQGDRGLPVTLDDVRDANASREPFSVSFVGADTGLSDVLPVRVLAGRWLRGDDGRSAVLPVVIDERAAQSLVASMHLASVADLVGVRVSTARGEILTVRIVGVVESFTLTKFVAASSAMVFVPSDSLDRLPLGGQRNVSDFRMLALVSPSGVEQARAGLLDDVSRYLALREEVGVSISAFRADGAGDFAEASRALSIVLGAIAVIALLVGALGVLNVSLMSVKQRVREFGLRRAVGAQPRDIFFLILFESMAVTSIGGILGVLSAAIISMLFGPLLAQFLGDVPVGSISLWSAFAGMAVAVCTGLISGLLPAARARRASVLDAIRR